MKSPLNQILTLVLPLFIISLSFSCSRDTDLLSDYVITENIESIVIGNYVVSDRFILAPDNSIILDVLSNDSYINSDQVEIIKTSEPSNGTIEINDDQTLTYIPNVSIEEQDQTTDNFTYTIETQNVSGTKENQEAAVEISLGLGELKAFPSAEGFGKNATGGRGGKVIHVTNLNESGSGSLTEAMYASGTRTIVFDVSGEIYWEQEHSITNGNVTIAGETAPGDGITIKGSGISIRTNNVIMRYLRIRPGIANDNRDAIRFLARVAGSHRTNIIVDHCSFSWGTDEIVEFGTKYGGKLSNITLQNCIISEGLTNYALLTGRNMTNVSIVQNLFANTPNRIPETSYGDTDESYEFSNNIIYNYNRATVLAFGTKADIIGNVYRMKNTPSVPCLQYQLNKVENPNASPQDGKVHQSDNIQIGSNPHGLTDSGFDNYGLSGRVMSNSLFTPNSANSLEAYLMGDVGANVFNDPVDKRVINEYFNNTGVQGPNTESQVGGYPSLVKTVWPKTYDTDKDGISDEWELSKGLNPNDGEDGKNDRNGDGYSNLEEFLHHLTQQ